MQISELRDDFQRRLLSFVWDQWAQMGVLTSGSRRDQWAADPEALLLLTFEVGRDDPRLFDEVLDWMVVNERLISVQRLRNLARDDADRALVEAVLGWLARWRRQARLVAKPSPDAVSRDPVPFFRGDHVPVGDPDPAFLARGFLKPLSEPPGNSQPSDMELPINFAFRMRALLGIGARAEAARVVLTARSPWVSVQVIAASTAYTKRNVQEALNSLRAAGALGSTSLGNEQRFEAPQERWKRFLELSELPVHEDWPQLFGAYRVILRWLWDPSNEVLSEYMRSSEARALMEEVVPDLQFAGVAIDSAGPEGPDYWPRFVAGLRELGPV